jgi:hypothetical protein
MPPASQLIIDFGEIKVSRDLTVHFVCMLLRYSRLLAVFAQDHSFNAEEACRAVFKFFSKCSGRPAELVIDQDSVFVTDEQYGEVTLTRVFADFVKEQGLKVWVCNKADPESKGPVENLVGYVKKNFFSARSFTAIEDVLRSLPAWVERKNRRIHQATLKVPVEVFQTIEQPALLPLLPSVYEVAPLNLTGVDITSMPYIQYHSSKYSVPRSLCYSKVYYRVSADRLHVYDSNRRYVCSHDLNPEKGSFNRLPEHKKEPTTDWMDTAERLREKYNCLDFQHFINGFKKENPRHLAAQLNQVEIFLERESADRLLVADVMAVCCREFCYRFSQFRQVYEQVKAGRATFKPNAMTDIELKSLKSYQRAFEERMAT